jgi:hypothetical protein
MNITRVTPDKPVDELWVTTRRPVDEPGVIPRVPAMPWQPVSEWGRPANNSAWSDQREHRVLHNPQALSLQLFEEDQSLVRESEQAT